MRVTAEYTDYNFCLDKQKLRIEKANVSAEFVQFEIDGTFKIDDTYIEFETTYQVPYFRNEVVLDLGEKVQSYVLKLTKNYLSTSAELLNVVMSPIDVNISCKNLDKHFVELAGQQQFNYKFYPGARPKCYPLLTNHSLRRRVSGTKMLLSYTTPLAPSSWGYLKALPNVEGEDLVCLKITESEMSFPKEKRIEGLHIITFPPTRNIINVQWLNQNLVPDWATFTGEYQIFTAFEHRVNKGVFVKDKLKFHTEKQKSLKINTGFLLKSETLMIEELMESPFCFIELENRMLKCIPSSEKITSEDSTSQLIQLDLEFLIVEEIWK